MSLETDRWNELTADQARFFGAHLVALSEAVFMPGGQEVGITPLNAVRYNVRPDTGISQAVPALMWPDPTHRNTACVVIGNGRNNTAFVRAGAVVGGFELEGIVLDSIGPNIYGQQTVLKHDIENDVGPFHAALSFFAGAKEQARMIHQARTGALAVPRSSLSSPQSLEPRIVGIEGPTSARLYRSLSSYHDNLAVGGTLAEKGNYTSHTYDLAHTLLKMTVASMVNNKMPEDGAIIPGSNGQVAGAIFDSPRHGITVIRRLDAATDAIAVATARPPERDSDAVLIEQYMIKAWGTELDTFILPGEAYNRQAIFGVLTSKSDNPKVSVSDLTPPACLDESSTAALEQKIIRMMSDLAALRTP